MKSIKKSLIDEIYTSLWENMWNIRVGILDEKLRLYVDTQTWDYMSEKIEVSVCIQIDNKYIHQ